MILPFSDSGYLPPGVHPANLDGVQDRFGRMSRLRCIQMEYVHEMIELAQGADIERIVLGGSFVTDIMEPKDVDCALLLNPDLRGDRDKLRELSCGLPFITPALVGPREFDRLIGDFFGTDARGKPRGVVEIIHWS